MKLALLGLLGFGVLGCPVFAEDIPLTILHTNDLHSAFEGAGPDRAFTAKVGDHDPVQGHFARLAHLIRTTRQEVEARGEAVLVLDDGDFSQGTLFQVLGPSVETPVSPELEFFQLARYDATTLGNHEFDSGETGLARLIGKAIARGVMVPIVETAMSFRRSEPRLEVLMHHGDSLQSGSGIHEVLIRTLHSKGHVLRVAVLGALGPDAIFASATTRSSAVFAGYDDAHSKAHLTVLARLLNDKALRLKREHLADAVVLLLHGGMAENKDLLADAPAIDVLIAGHSHELYSGAAGNAVYAQAGSRGSHLGVMELSWDGARIHWRADHPWRKIPVDDAVAADRDVLDAIAAWKKPVSQIIASTGYAYDTPIFKATNVFPIKDSNDPAALGPFVCNAMRSELARRKGIDVDVYFTSAGLVRSTLSVVDGLPTTYQFSDIFRVLPMGPDGERLPGASVVDFYLRPSDVKKLVEFTEFYSGISRYFRGVFSDSMSYQVRRWGIPLWSRVKNLTVHGKPLDDSGPLIHVATNARVVGYFQELPSLTWGLVTIPLRDKTGKLIPGAPPAIDEVREYSLLADTLRRQSPP